MNKSDLVFVSGLFDIGRANINDDGFKRSFDHYLEATQKLFKIPYNLVFYTTPDLNDWVWKHRSRENTVVVNKTLDELRAFPFYNQVQKIRTNDTWKKQSGWMEHSPQVELELYSILSFHKFFWLHDATLFNHFNANNYVWIDSGINNTMNTEHYISSVPDFEERLLPHLQNKIAFLAFPYDGQVEVHGFAKNKMNEYAGANTQHVCRGGFFGGDKQAIHEMNDIYYHTLNDTLNGGCLGTEESVFTILSYKHKDKCNINNIESNGLIFKFFENLKNESIKKLPSQKLAFYYLTFNTPTELERTLQTHKEAYPKTFLNIKKYAVNNSNDPSVDEHYKRLFKEYDIEEFKMDNNLGIMGGRIWVADHFQKSDHQYYVFFEEDMGMYPSVHGVCKNGLPTYVDDKVFDKVIEIMDTERFDALRLTFTEFFGDCFASWSYVNTPREKKDLFYPPKDGYIEGKVYQPNLLNKPKIEYLGTYKGVSYASGNFHISNWPILMSKNGNSKIYLETTWAHPYEATTMSHANMLWEDKQLKIGSLLASIINHNRVTFYDGARRRENANYTN